MLGFWQLRSKIRLLDYRAWSRVVGVLQQLEAYTREAKKLRDRTALEEAGDILEGWRDSIPASINAAVKEQDSVVQTNLGRTAAAIRQLLAFL